MRVVEEGHASPEINITCQRHRLSCPKEHPFVTEDLVLACRVVRDAYKEKGTKEGEAVFNRNVIPILQSLEGKTQKS